MKHLLPAAVLALLLTVPAAAQDFLKGMEAYWEGDYAAALQEFRPLAEQGDATAQYNLGLMYYDGEGVPQDYAEAVKWYRLAAEQGRALAQHNLGVMYDKGQGVPQDYVQAHMWFNLAASRHKNSDNRENSAKGRDSVAGLMTAAQIAEAQKLAREWAERFAARE